MDVEALVARPIAGLVAVDDARAPLRVVIASLAPGGAERIVLEWLAAERSRGRDVDLAVLHARRNSLAVPQGIPLRVRRKEESLDGFVRTLAREWEGHEAPIATHLVTDDVLAMLWSAGFRTVPTIHNAADGWRNDPRSWSVGQVPTVVACADSVREELFSAGCAVPLVTLRHRPRVGPAAFDGAMRETIRAELRIGAGVLLVGAIGAIKAQKDYVRAIEVLHELARERDAVLAIFGGVLDAAGLGELDRVMQRAVELRVAARLRLPGFVRPIEPWLAACDAIVNVSRFEGLSMAVQEALAAGLPVVATDVGGQREVEHRSLTLVAAHASARQVAGHLARLPVRASLEGKPQLRAPRVWSMATFPREAAPRSRLETLFVTANLNAGGAQRSLANLAVAIRSRHRFAVAVCDDTTHPAFASELRARGIEAFRPAPTSDPLSVAESLLAHAGRRGARSLCFWNADARVKLLVAKFAPPGLRIVDVSPGEYAFEEMKAAQPFAESVAASEDAYYRRLDVLVLKYNAPRHPRCRSVTVIRNGVDSFALAPRPAVPRILVSGRIAPSKRLEAIFAAFAHVRLTRRDAELHVFGNVEERHRAYASQLCGDAIGVALRGPSFDHAHLREPWTAAIVLGTHQGCPNAALEAMAAGIPVIANDSGGTRELVMHGLTGWLLPESAQPGEIAAAMAESAADGPRSAAMGERARDHVRAHHAMEAMAARYLDVLSPETAAAHEKISGWIPAPESPPTFASPASSP